MLRKNTTSRLAITHYKIMHNIIATSFKITNYFITKHYIYIIAFFILNKPSLSTVCTNRLHNLIIGLVSNNIL